MALITNLLHFLDEQGEIAAEIPGPALDLALFLGAIVGWVTIRQVDHSEETNVPCLRRQGRRRCTGPIFAHQDGSTIMWECPVCGDHGVITGWEDTFWDRRTGLRPSAPES